MSKANAFNGNITNIMEFEFAVIDLMLVKQINVLVVYFLTFAHYFTTRRLCCSVMIFECDYSVFGKNKVRDRRLNFYFLNPPSKLSS